MSRECETLVFFGGGNLLLRCVERARARGYSATVFAAPRHSAEIVAPFPGDSPGRFGDWLESRGLPFHVVEDINGCDDFLSLGTRGATGIGFGETYTFSRETVAVFQHRLFDMMVIRLPQYRGGAHFSWQILRGSRLGAWNIQEIDERMIPGVRDEGSVVMTREYFIPPSARIPADFFEIADREGEELFSGFLDRLRSKDAFFPRKIDNGYSLYFPRLYTSAHAWIDWSWTAEELERFVCAFDDPYPGASTFLHGKRVFFKNVSRDPTEGRFHPFMSGLVYRIDARGVFVACRDEALVVRDIRDESGTHISEIILPGSRFVTPRSFLDEALSFEANYDARGLSQDVRHQGGSVS